MGQRGENPLAQTGYGIAVRSTRWYSRVSVDGRWVRSAYTGSLALASCCWTGCAGTTRQMLGLSVLSYRTLSTLLCHKALLCRMRLVLVPPRARNWSGTL